MVGFKFQVFLIKSEQYLISIYYIRITLAAFFFHSQQTQTVYVKVLLPAGHLEVTAPPQSCELFFTVF